jgi:hypothetical protein
VAACWTRLRSASVNAPPSSAEYASTRSRNLLAAIVRPSARGSGTPPVLVRRGRRRAAACSIDFLARRAREENRSWGAENAWWPPGPRQARRLVAIKASSNGCGAQCAPNHSILDAQLAYVNTTLRRLPKFNLVSLCADGDLGQRAYRNRFVRSQVRSRHGDGASG